MLLAGRNVNGRNFSFREGIPTRHRQQQRCLLAKSTAAPTLMASQPGERSPFPWLQELRQAHWECSLQQLYSCDCMFLCVLAFEVIQLLGWEQSSVGRNACPMHKALAPPLPKPDKVSHVCNPRAWEGEAERLRCAGPSWGAVTLW